MLTAERVHILELAKELNALLIRELEAEIERLTQHLGEIETHLAAARALLRTDAP